MVKFLFFLFYIGDLYGIPWDFKVYGSFFAKPNDLKMALCRIQWGYLYLGRSGIKELYIQSWRLGLQFLLNLSSRVWRARKSNNLLQGSSIWYCWHILQCTSNHKGWIYCAKPLINIWLHQFCISSFLNQILGPIFQGFLMNSVNIRGFLMNSINSRLGC